MDLIGPKLYLAVKTISACCQ